MIFIRYIFLALVGQLKCLFNVLPDEQLGFLCGCSTERQLLSVVEDWHITLGKRNPIHAAFLDVAKTFDKVDHQILLMTLSQIGVQETASHGSAATSLVGRFNQGSVAVFPLFSQSLLASHRAQSLVCSSSSFISKTFHLHKCNLCIIC